MFKIFIVEDQQLIRQGLVALLSLEEGITVIGEAENGQIALNHLEKLSPKERPNVVLMDIRMPIMDGVATTGVLSQRYPTIKVLVLTTFDDDALITQAMAAGAKGYLLKDTPSEDVAMAIRTVAKGHSHFGPGIVQKMMEALPQTAAPSPQENLPSAENNEAIAALTPREKEVLVYLGQGASNREIAEALYISEGTVKNHVTRILSQLGLRDRTQAALLAQSSHIKKFQNNQ